MKNFRFLLALLALLAPSGSWAAWPGECTKVIAIGSVSECPPEAPLGCSNAHNLVNVSINLDGTISVTNAGLSGYWRGVIFSGSYDTWYFEDGIWKIAGNSGSVLILGGLQFDAELNAPRPPIGTCGPPSDPCQDEAGNPAGDCPPPDEPKPEPPYDRPKNFGLSCPPKN